MISMKTDEIRNKIIDFHKKQGYNIKSAVSMANSAFPYTFNASAAEIYMKEIIESNKKNPENKFLVIQPCFRRVDIDNVKLNGYTTLFEMVGKICFTPAFQNEKENQLKEMLNFLIDELGLEKSKIWITIFGGGKVAEIGETKFPEDIETKKLWIKLGIPETRIVSLKNSKNNIDNFLVRFERDWENYAGYGTDIFYDLGEKFSKNSQDIKPGLKKGGRFIELATIWMLDKWRTSKRGESVNLIDSSFKNFAIGFSIERLAFVLQETKTIFEIDSIKPFLSQIETYDLNKKYELCDILRSIFFIMSEGNNPGKRGKEYDLRLLFRKLFILLERNLIQKSKTLISNILKQGSKDKRKSIFSEIGANEEKFLSESYKIFLDYYKKSYTHLKFSLGRIKEYYAHEKFLFYENQFKK